MPAGPFFTKDTEAQCSSLQPVSHFHPALRAFKVQLSCFSSYCHAAFGLEPQEADSHEGDSLAVSPGLCWSQVVELSSLETCSPRNLNRS